MSGWLDTANNTFSTLVLRHIIDWSMVPTFKGLDVGVQTTLLYLG